MKKNWFTIKELYPNIWGIGEFAHFEKVISYLFIGKNNALLFDTGMGIGNIKNTVMYLTKLPIMIINSHCHYDHIGGNKLFSDIRIFETNFSKKIAKNGINNFKFKKFLNKYSQQANVFDNNYSIPSFQYSPLFDNQIIDIDPFQFKVIHTNGHTSDSICLYEKNRKLLLAGDTMYNGPIYLYFKESNIEDYKKSIKKLTIIKNVNNILPGHNSFSLSPKLLYVIDKKLSTTDHFRDSLYISENIHIVFSKA
jgi:glyoxylase-like metal-dependent hydrolase (beta-lactamase superfamily II)